MTRKSTFAEALEANKTCRVGDPSGAMWAVGAFVDLLKTSRTISTSFINGNWIIYAAPERLTVYKWTMKDGSTQYSLSQDFAELHCPGGWTKSSFVEDK